MGRREWKEVSAAEPCPVCGGSGWCKKYTTAQQVSSGFGASRVVELVDGCVLCMRIAAGGGNAPEKVAGYTLVGKPGKGGGAKYRPAGAGGVVVDAARAAELERQRQEQAAREREEAVQAFRRFAAAILDGAAANHAKARAYVEARGIPLDRLPGGTLPADLLYVPRLAYVSGDQSLPAGPAIVAVCRDQDGHAVGAQRIYLALDGSPRKRAPEDCGGGPARKYIGVAAGAALRLVPPGEPSPTLCVAEGVETALAVVAATGLPTLAAISANNLGACLPVREPWAAAVRRVVFCADLDTIKPAMGFRPGTTLATLAAGKVRHAGVEALVVAPSHADAPSLVTPEGEVAASVAPTPTSEVAQGHPAGRGARGDSASSVDWNDVARVAGLDAVARAIVGAGTGGAGTGHEASGTGGEEVGGGGEGGGGGGDEGGGDGGDDEEDGRWVNGYFVDRDGRRYLPPSPLARARVVLLELFSPRERAGSRWLVAWWAAGACWLRWTGDRYRVVDADELRGRVLDYYESWYVKAKNGPAKASLSVRAAAEVVEAMQVDAGVDLEALPGWAPPTFGPDGSPRYGVAIDLPASVPSGRFVAIKDGLLDVDRLAAGELVLRPLTPLFVNCVLPPQPIPVARVRAALDEDRAIGGGGGAPGNELCRELCPRWLELLETASEGDDDFITGLQRYFGLLLTDDVSYERAVWITGMKRSGKGTIAEAAMGIVGPEAVANTSFDDLARPFTAAQFIGKRLVYLDDVAVGKHTDDIVAVRQLKTMISGMPVAVDVKHQEGRPNVRLRAKFMLTSDRLVRLRDPSNALAERLLVFFVPRKYQGEPRPDVKRKVLEELPGIMVWALMGLVDLERSRRLLMPERGRTSLRMFERLSSPVKSFLDDCCVIRKECRVRAKVIFELYEAWCEDQGLNSASMEVFAGELAGCVPDFESVGEQTAAAGKFRVWVGLRPRLRADEASPPTPELVDPHVVMGNGRLLLRVGGISVTDQVEAAEFAEFEFELPSEHEQDNLI